jgi:hypothetical protein
MSGVPRELVEHKLKVYPQARPIQQKLCRFTPDKREAIRPESARLVVAGFIREVLHPEWLANPVLVLKKNKVDWRMCIDYTDLNKHCSKDPFGLPRIDQMVDSTAGCSMLSFLDYYSGYHQISLAKEDEEKTAFITPFGAFCYTSMSFGLKNAGATYQRAIQTCLADHWGKRVEAYVDDVVIKTENSENFIEDMQLIFNSSRRYRWKLNLEKCVFGVPAGKLLRFIVSHQGIEANLEKNRGHHENGSAAITEKGTEAYWMHGSPKQVHIKARGERHAILQIAQKGGQVSVDHRGTGRSRGTKKSS